MSLEGQQIDRYRIMRLLGSGGMGEVYLAEDARIAQQVAIKVIRTEVTPYPDANSAKEAARLFEREAKAIARLDHPNILPLYAYGEETVHGQQLTYLVMPYRKEGTLASWLRQRGTPTYMAPEQWDGQPVAATDQYALAIMAYELLTGRPPFSGNLGQIMRQHFQAVPQPPSALNPALSPALDAVLLRALAKEPQARFPSVSDFAQAFQQAALAPLAATLPSPSPSPSTVLKETPPIAQSGKDLRSTLAISQKEAMSGTSRMLTLPNGRRVLVTVPARASDGQVIRLEGFGEPSRTGGPAGSLVLTLLVKAAEEAPPLAPASATGAEETVLTATPEAAAPSAPTVRTTAQQATASPPARPERSTPPSLESSPTEVATPASQGSFSLTELALPSKPSMGRPAERSQVNQAEQQTDVVPADRPSRSPERFTAQSAQRGLSRRTVLVGLGLTGLAVAGGGITWWVLTPHLGTTLYTYHGHSGSVDAVAWSPDGRRIALGSYDKTVQVWVAAV